MFNCIIVENYRNENINLPGVRIKRYSIATLFKAQFMKFDNN